MELDIDNELKAVEDNQRLIQELERYKTRIGNEGICRESGLGLESLLGGSIRGMDSRKLTVNPSNTGRELALEAINFKQLLSVILGFGLVFTLLIKIFSWLFGSSSGGGGGGGGSNASRKAREFQKEAESRLSKEMETAQNWIDEIQRNPQPELKRMAEEYGAYDSAPHTVETLMKLVTQDDRYNLEQASIVYARLMTWFGRLFPHCTDADVARQNNDPAFILPLYMIIHPDAVFDFSFCGFMDKVPCISHDQAHGYTKVTDSSRYGQRYDSSTQSPARIQMDKYFRRKDLEQAGAMMEGVEIIVDDSTKMLQAITKNLDKSFDDLMEDKEFTNMMGRMLRTMFGDENNITWLKTRPEEERNRVMTMVRNSPAPESPHLFMVNLGLKEPKYKAVQAHRPNQLGHTPSDVLLWNKTFEACRESRFNNTLPKSINRGPDLFPAKIHRIADLIRHCLKIENREKVIEACMEGQSRELARFNNKIEVTAKRLERKAIVARKIANELTEKEKRLMIGPGHGITGNFMESIRMFLETAVESSRDMVQYCRNIEAAQKSTETMLVVMQTDL
ncbi:MAG: hypothetical protein ACRDDY_13830 [Clostridium sp.]|uniref:hypothetical protein n=1 Tax=Clostridium sp. TaxID=1506 RepID=UPI003EE571E4